MVIIIGIILWVYAEARALECIAKRNREYLESLGPCAQVTNKLPNNVVEFLFPNETRFVREVSPELYSEIWRLQIRRYRFPEKVC